MNICSRQLNADSCLLFNLLGGLNITEFSAHGNSTPIDIQIGLHCSPLTQSAHPNIDNFLLPLPHL